MFGKARLNEPDSSEASYQIAFRPYDRQGAAMAGILVGYARVSTYDQQAGLDAQLRDLKSAGYEEIFSEQVSAVAQRDRLKEALRFVRRGDSLVVCKPDRLARSTTDLLRIVEGLDRRGVGLIMLSMGGQQIDTRSPTRKLMVTMLAAIAEFERGLLLERQKEGVAKAKADGKYKGRKPTARAKTAEVLRLGAEGLQRTAIAERLDIGVASVYRALAVAKKGVGGRKVMA
jgi:DNA invertase Pin-like site-specific DNA recombinase